jgi:phage host-nuclease inhibitor protein Gam
MAQKKREPQHQPPPVVADIQEIASWRDVDTALGVLRRDDGETARINAHYDKAIQHLQEQKALELAPLQERTGRVARLVEGFVSERRAELGGKTRKLVNGKVGYRIGGAKASWSGRDSHLIAVLKIRGHGACVVLEEKIDKEALKDLPTPELLLCGVTVKRTERFFVELATDPVVDLPPETA